MKFFDQYKGLRRDLYILFWGRVVTAMGGLIWPMLTLILKNKLGHTTGEVANIMLIVGLLMLPCTLIGGKMADKYNKKNIIVVCDMVTVISYIICGLMPMSDMLVPLFCIAGVFAQVEWPSYDALVANLSTQEERERAYSLQYMGMNLGLILAPTLGGLLFENHLGLAFIISGLATFSSTVLIFFFIKDITPSEETSEAGKYEEAREGAKTTEVFKAAPVLMLFVVCMGFESALYSIGNGFMMPMNLESTFLSKGAFILGTLTSVNAVTVIIGTPLATSCLYKLKDSAKLFVGEFLQLSGYVLFMTAGSKVSFYYIGMVVFTMGEVFVTLGRQPYITRRVPASHRGRMSAVITVAAMTLQEIMLYITGVFADIVPMTLMWMCILMIGAVVLVLLIFLIKGDKKQFPLLY